MFRWERGFGVKVEDEGKKTHKIKLASGPLTDLKYFII